MPEIDSYYTTGGAGAVLASQERNITPTPQPIDPARAKELDVASGKAYKDAQGNVIYGTKPITRDVQPSSINRPYTTQDLNKDVAGVSGGGDLASQRSNILHQIEQEFALKVQGEEQAGKQNETVVNAELAAAGIMGGTTSMQSIASTRQKTADRVNQLGAAKAQAVTQALQELYKNDVAIAQWTHETQVGDEQKKLDAQGKLQQIQGVSQEHFKTVASTSPQSWDDFAASQPDAARMYLQQTGWDSFSAGILWNNYKTQGARQEYKGTQYDESTGNLTIFSQKPDGSYAEQKIKVTEPPKGLDFGAAKTSPDGSGMIIPPKQFTGDPSTWASQMYIYQDGQFIKATDKPVVPVAPGTEGQGSVAFRTNNPGNIKWTGASWQTALGAVDSGIQAKDGGTFAKFPSLDVGTNAQKQLLTSSTYSDLTLDQAMKKWSNNGYGADVSPSLPAQTKIKDLKPEQLSQLMGDMKNREGFTAPTSPTDRYADVLKGRDANQVAAFNSLKENEKSNVSQLLSGTLIDDLMKSRGVSGNAARQKLIDDATKVDPTFTPTKNKQRNTFITEWNNPNGVTNKTILAGNTALGHLATLKKWSDQLVNNGDFQKANSVKQFIDSNINTPGIAEAVANFDDTMEKLAHEIANFYAGGVADVASVQAQRNVLNSTKPSNVLQSVINNNASLLSSKVASQSEQYKKVMGSYPQSPILNFDALQGLKSSGVDVTESIMLMKKQGYDVPPDLLTMQLNGKDYILADDGKYYPK